MVAQSNADFDNSPRKYALEISEEIILLKCKPIDTHMYP